MNENEEQGMQDSPMIKIATFIVDKRNLFFLIFALAVIFSLVAMSWVNVENDLAAFLPESAETTVGLDLMEEQFTTYGSAKVMVTNINYNDADNLKTAIENMKDVAMVTFDDTKDHYNNFSALYDVTFSYDENNDKCLIALDNLKSELSDYDIYVSTSLGNQEAEIIKQEISVIIVYVAIIVLVVLLLTSQTYGEVPVMIITFLSSIAIAMGTNFIFGTISFVSNSVSSILQLALSVDYAVIYCNRYKDEHRFLDSREADIIALSKAIPEISASSLTTVGGLIAMSFMQYGIGPDLAIVLIKSIVISLLSVFLLMPGLLMLFSKMMDNTKHKNFVPDIPFVGKFAYKTRFFIPPFFVVCIIAGCILANKCPYVYGYSLLTTPVLNETQIADNMIKESFGDSNMVAFMVPSGDYSKEKQMLYELDNRPEVKSSTGLANTEAMDGYMLADKLNAREFSELMDVDYELAELLYTAYAVNDENYGRIVGGISSYSVPLIDILMFLYDEVQEGYVTLEDDLNDDLEIAHTKMSLAKNQLLGENYSRVLLFLNLPEEGEETFAFLEELHEIGKKYYGEDANIVVCGNATSQRDLKKTFERDNAVVSVVSIMAVLVVLLFTFKSVGMPLLLILVIQGAIWINFSFPYITDTKLFFMGYLIVSSIQMGANIDYAIVISSRFQEVKREMTRKDAIIDTMNFAFPTIITSGTMLAAAGFLIGQMTSEPCIVGIGQCLGRGTVISIILVMFVLPQILLLGDKLIDKTSFVMNVPLADRKRNVTGTVRLDGYVRGRIEGTIIGNVHAIVKGDVNAVVDTMVKLEDDTDADMSQASSEVYAIEAKEVDEDVKNEE